MSFLVDLAAILEVLSRTFGSPGGIEKDDYQMGKSQIII